MKKFVAGIIGLVCVLTAQLAPAAAKTVKDKIQFAVSGKYAGTVDTLEVDGRVFVQAQTVCRLLKGTAYWSAKSGGLSCKLKRTKVEFKKSGKDALIDGKAYAMSAGMRVSDGMPFVPVDFITGDYFGPAAEREISYNELAHSLDADRPYNVGQVDYFSYGTSMRLGFELRGVSKYTSVEKGPRHVQITVADAVAQTEEKVTLNDEFVRSVSVRGFNGSVLIDIYLTADADSWTVQREQDTLVVDVTKKSLESGLADNSAGEGETAAPASQTAQPDEAVYGVTVVKDDDIRIPDVISPNREGRKLIVIDPGHGGKDPGGRKRNGLPEKSLNLRVASELAKLFKEDGGYDVLVTRTSDYYLPLPQRCQIANSKQADLFISIHANANNSRREKGFEVYFMSENATDPMSAAVAAKENAVLLPGEKMLMEDPAEQLLHSMARNEYMNESARLSGMIVKRLGQRTPFKNRGVKQAAFYVLRGTYAPAVLVEMGFMSNAEDCKNLNKPKVLEKIAQGIYEGIDDYAKANGWK